MSYGIAIVILEEDIEKQNIRYDFCDWTVPISLRLYPKSCRDNFKNKWFFDLKKEKKITTLEKLLTAPCDFVCIINNKGDFKLLENRKPIPYLNIEEHFK